MRVVARVVATLASSAVLAGGLVGCADGHSPAAAGTFVGHRWRVVSISSTHGQLRMPHGHPPWIAFARSGRLTVADSVDSQHLHYRQEAGGLRTSGNAASFGWYVSRAAERVDGALVTTFGSGQHLGAAATGGRLVITGATYRIDCVRDGSA